MAMRSPSPSPNLCQVKWFHYLFPFILLTFLGCSSGASTLTYGDHCGSIVPESSPTAERLLYNPVLQTSTTYYTGGGKILGMKLDDDLGYERSLSFTTIPYVRKTNIPRVYKLKARLAFRSPNLFFASTKPRKGNSYYRSRPRYTGLVQFSLQGFWSESSGKICMVGSASLPSDTKARGLNLDAVLKLSYADMDSSMFDSFITGTLESLSQSDEETYFDPVRIFSLPKLANYSYTLVSPGLLGSVPESQSLGLQPASVCSTFRSRWMSFGLEYPKECNNCNPLEGADLGYVPKLVSLYTIQCNEEKLRYMIQFPNRSYIGYNQHFNPNVTLIGEGTWDSGKNRMLVVACRILGLNDPRVGDCSIRLSLMFPAIWTIKNSTRIVGNIWSNKTVNESGYFDRIKFYSFSYNQVKIPGLKYTYTELDRARNSCPDQKSVGKGYRYPSVHSPDMSFDFLVKDSKGVALAWGNAVPISVGDELYERNRMVVAGSVHPENESNAVFEADHKGFSNVSYRINLRQMRIPKPSYNFSSLNFSLIPSGYVKISAEGLYDDGSGHLCMVGCRELVSYTANESVDCEMLISFDFPAVGTRKSGGLIKGSIKSTRKGTDPLHFEQLDMSSMAFYTTAAKNSIRRMDLEIIVALVSNTLSCVFVGLQLYYIKKRPEMLPLISLLMLVILTLGQMIPLVLNFEALFLGNRTKQNLFLNNGKWIETNEVLVRLITMVAFLLQIRLLQLAWAERLGHEYGRVLWATETKVAFICLPLYLLGGLIAFLLNWKGKDLRHYAGLVLDGFLLPQILLNVLRDSREAALSYWFYLGSTLIRLLPHAYDLYRAQNYAYLVGSYIYAKPTADFYSTAWDVVIPCGGILFAVVVFLQQRYGGRCILPRKLRESVHYEKIPPTLASSELAQL